MCSVGDIALNPSFAKVNMNKINIYFEFPKFLGSGPNMVNFYFVNNIYVSFYDQCRELNSQKIRGNMQWCKMNSRAVPKNQHVSFFSKSMARL